MTVKELIIELEKMPEDMIVRDWAGYDIEQVFIDKDAEDEITIVRVY